MAGTRISATVPVAERLLNEIIAASLPQSGALREATVHPQSDNRLGVRVRLARPEFLPPLNATLIIDRQPELPHAPVLGFRVTGLPGLLALFGPVFSIARLLPPGIRLEGDRLLVDLAALLAARGQAQLLGYLDRLQVTSEAGRLVINFEAGIPSSAGT